MYLSEEQNKAFLGIYEKNENGETLEEFLSKYDSQKYMNPSCTVDTLVFAHEGAKLTKVLLIMRRNHPSMGMWALPGGFVDYKENLKDAALRELKEETGIENINAIQLKVYGDYDRDPRTRIVTTAFASIVDESDITFEAADDALQADWFDISVENLGDDMFKLVLTANRLRAQIYAEIKKTTNTIFGVSDNKYEVINRNGIAADHGAIILESYQYLMERISL